jgi:hypothetical protein
MHLKKFGSLHKVFFSLKFFLHRFSSDVSNKIMGELLSNSVGEENGPIPT